MTEPNGLTSDDDFVTVYDPPPGVITDQIREIASRRLAIISETLALAPDELERAHKAYCRPSTVGMIGSCRNSDDRLSELFRKLPIR